MTVLTGMGVGVDVAVGTGVDMGNVVAVAVGPSVAGGAPIGELLSPGNPIGAGRDGPRSDDGAFQFRGR